MKRGSVLQKSTLCLIIIRRKRYPEDENAQLFQYTINLNLCNMLEN